MTAAREEDFRISEGQGLFTPRDLLSLPRPGDGTANGAGDLAFVDVSQYSFPEKKTNRVIYIVPLQSTVATSTLPSIPAGDAFWLDDRTLGHVVEGKGDAKDIQELWAVSVEYAGSLVRILESPTLIGAFPSTTKLENFKYSAKSSVLVFSATTFDDFSLSSVKQQNTEYEARGHTAMIYDKLFVRHWDTWMGPTKASLFAIDLTRNSEGKWSLGQEAWSLQKDTGHYTPVGPFGGSSDFDVSKTHVIYTTKDPSLDPAWHTRQGIYLVPIKPAGNKIQPEQLTPGSQGATSSPVFSKDGKRAAWLEQAEDGYEVSKNQISVYNIAERKRALLASQFDRSPSVITFSLDGDTIYFVAGDNAHNKLWSVAVPWLPGGNAYPVLITYKHSAFSPQPLPGDRILFTQSSFISPKNLFVLSGVSQTQITTFGDGELAEQGKVLEPPLSFSFEGAEKGGDVHGWLFKPKGWKEAKENGGDMIKKYPVVLWIHGGPQLCWADEWDIEKSFGVFQHQGYFVIAINPTGSSTFGQKFTDAITKDWGGAPFVDLRKGFAHVLKTFPEIDPERAVAAGHSFGGYSINLIQSHPEWAFNFKGLVCHSGDFDIRYSYYATDEAYFNEHDFGGKPWDKEALEVMEKFNPINYVHKWSVPELVIQGRKDYRVNETDAIATFGALQARGVDSRLIMFPDENHFIQNAANSLKYYHEVFRWFDRCLNRGPK